MVNLDTEEPPVMKVTGHRRGRQRNKDGDRKLGQVLEMAQTIVDPEQASDDRQVSPQRFVRQSAELLDDPSTMRRLVGSRTFRQAFTLANNGQAELFAHLGTRARRRL